MRGVSFLSIFVLLWITLGDGRARAATSSRWGCEQMLDSYHPNFALWQKRAFENPRILSAHERVLQNLASHPRAPFSIRVHWAELTSEWERRLSRVSKEGLSIHLMDQEIERWNPYLGKVDFPLDIYFSVLTLQVEGQGADLLRFIEREKKVLWVDQISSREMSQWGSHLSPGVREGILFRQEGDLFAIELGTGELNAHLSVLERLNEKGIQTLDAPERSPFQTAIDWFTHLHFFGKEAPRVGHGRILIRESDWEKIRYGIQLPGVEKVSLALLRWADPIRNLNAPLQNKFSEKEEERRIQDWNRFLRGAGSDVFSVTLAASWSGPQLNALESELRERNLLLNSEIRGHEGRFEVRGEKQMITRFLEDARVDLFWSLKPTHSSTF